MAEPDAVPNPDAPPKDAPPKDSEKKEELKISKDAPGLMEGLDKLKKKDEPVEDPSKDKTEIEVRPENVPEKFWDTEKGELRRDSLLKSYDDREKELSRLKGDVTPVKDFREYLADDMVKDGKLVLPEELEEEVTVDDPVLVGIMESLQARGASKEMGQEIIKDMFAVLAKNVGGEIDVEAEMARLGENGMVVMEANHTWIDGLVSSKTISEIEKAMLYAFSQDAEGMTLLNKIRMETGENPIPSMLKPADGTDSSMEKWNEMMDDPRYKTEEAWREKTDLLGEKVHGTAPATSTMDIPG